MLNFMQVNYILHGFCVPQNCPLPAVCVYFGLSRSIDMNLAVNGCRWDIRIQTQFKLVLACSLPSCLRNAREYLPSLESPFNQRTTLVRGTLNLQEFCLRIAIGWCSRTFVPTLFSPCRVHQSSVVIRHYSNLHTNLTYGLIREYFD